MSQIYEVNRGRVDVDLIQVPIPCHRQKTIVWAICFRDLSRENGTWIKSSVDVEEMTGLSSQSQAKGKLLAHHDLKDGM